MASSSRKPQPDWCAACAGSSLLHGVSTTDLRFSAACNTEGINLIVQNSSIRRASAAAWLRAAKPKRLRSEARQ